MPYGIKRQEVIKEIWNVEGFRLITLFQAVQFSDLNHLYTDLTRTFICNYSYMDNSDYTAQGRVATFSHQHKSQLVWMAAKLWDCPSLLVWRTWTLNRTETPIKTTPLPPSFQINWIAALFSVSRNWNWKKGSAIVVIWTSSAWPKQSFWSFKTIRSSYATALPLPFKHL